MGTQPVSLQESPTSRSPLHGKSTCAAPRDPLAEDPWLGNQPVSLQVSTQTEDAECIDKRDFLYSSLRRFLRAAVPPINLNQMVID